MEEDLCFSIMQLTNRKYLKNATAAVVKILL